MANKSQRFLDKSEQVPGPGAYAVENKENKSSSNPDLKVKIYFYLFRKKSNLIYSNII